MSGVALWPAGSSDLQTDRQTGRRQTGRQVTALGERWSMEGGQCRHRWGTVDGHRTGQMSPAGLGDTVTRWQVSPVGHGGHGFRDWVAMFVSGVLDVSGMSRMACHAQ